MTDVHPSAARSNLGGQRIDLLEREHLLKAVEDAFEGRRRPLRLASANLDHVYCFDGKDLSG